MTSGLIRSYLFERDRDALAERVEVVIIFPDAAEEVRHDEGEDDGLLEERLGRLQTGDVLPANTGVVAYDLAGDLRTAIGHLVHQFSLSFS